MSNLAPKWQWFVLIDRFRKEVKKCGLAAPAIGLYMYQSHSRFDVPYIAELLAETAEWQ